MHVRILSPSLTAGMTFKKGQLVEAAPLLAHILKGSDYTRATVWRLLNAHFQRREEPWEWRPLDAPEGQEVLFTGSRKVLMPVVTKTHLRPDDIILQGSCHGLDQDAAVSGVMSGRIVRTIPAQWKKHGKAAGPFRNKKMVDRKPRLVIGVLPAFNESRGTQNCLEYARQAGLPIEVFVWRPT